MNKKQRMLLRTIELSRKISRMRLVKIMFLLSREPELRKRNSVYSFVPYKFGPFSFEMYNDLYKLTQSGKIREENESIVYINDTEIKIDHITEELLRNSLAKLIDMDERELIEDIYRAYPEYTIFSEIEKRQPYTRDETGIVTTGYEGISIDAFLNKLILNKVQILVDVRKNPISRRYSFSKTRLQKVLARFNIEYQHIPEFGIDTQDRKGLSSLDDYRRLFVRYRNGLDSRKAELNRIIELGRDSKIAMMCYESDIRYCHRGVISDVLKERGLGVEDI